MQVVSYTDRGLLYVKIKQVQPLVPLRTKEDIANKKFPLRGWKQPILSGVDERQNTVKLHSIVLNDISLDDLDELIIALQKVKEKCQAKKK